MTTQHILGNPIFRNFISEFTFGDNLSSWKIELCKYDDIMDTTSSLDSAYLVSSSDTAYIKKGINFSSDFLIINQDSLNSEFTINSKADTIIFQFNDGIGMLMFGETGFPPSPDTGQSLSLISGNDFYLDNSPTMGSKNDTIDATGNIKFILENSNGEKLENVFCYEWIGSWPEIICSTNHDGVIQMKRISGKYSFNFSINDTLFFDLCEDWEDPKAIKKSLTVLPEKSYTNIIQIPDSILLAVHGTESKKPILTEYKLYKNYPNPFNSTTKISYHLPISDYIEMNLYDIAGNLQKNIESGYKSSGRHDLKINLNDLHSGVYLYSLETANKTITRKCMLLK